MKRISVVLSLLVCAVLLSGFGRSAIAASSPASHVLERRSSPPNVVGLKLPEGEAKLRAAGWTPRPFNTDTLFGIVIKRHYTICKEYAPIGRRVRLLAQKYGC